MRALSFSSRCGKEILRDPLTLIFGVGLPVVLLFFIHLLSSNIPTGNNAFELANFAPGMAVFSFSFVSLFTALLISGDRTSSFLSRLFASPMTPGEFMLSYALPMLPVALAQGVVCFAFAFILGLDFTVNVFLALLVLVPVAAMYIAFGMLFGSAFADKQVGGIFSIFVNLTTWLSGTWFELELIGGAFEIIGYLLPFAHAVKAVSCALCGSYGEILPHLAWVIGYAVAVSVPAVLIFKRKMRG